ncbi:response regulator [Pseudomonas lalucatii]|nr:response regulator [Pseudomonas lalucatii]
MSTHNLRLLLIEDDEDDYLITRDLLRESGQLRYQLDWVSDYEAALTALEQRAHDLYLVDYRLGTENGLDLIAHAQGLGIRAPLILLTGQGDDELDASAIDMGAADYLIKGEFNSQMLVRSIRYAWAGCMPETHWPVAKPVIACCSKPTRKPCTSFTNNHWPSWR